MPRVSPSRETGSIMHEAFETIAEIQDYDMRKMLVLSLLVDASTLYQAVDVAVNALSMVWPENMRLELEIIFSDTFKELMEAMR